MIKEEIFNFFSAYIHKHTGITYNKDNDYGLISRLKNLAQILELNNVDELFSQYQQEVTPEMHEILTDMATNNETCFFRDGKPFRILANDVIPEIMNKNSDSKRISIWSAACSTGQEPYSILMTMKDRCPLLNMWEVRMDASDISRRVLKQAKAGVFTQLQIQRGLPIVTLQKYFSQIKDGGWLINNKLLPPINFLSFNLLNGHYTTRQYDIVFCRNVLIYQTVSNRKIITEKLYDSLVKGGYLFLGNGESLLRINEKFDQKTFSGGTVFHKS